METTKKVLTEKEALERFTQLFLDRDWETTCMCIVIADFIT